MFWTQVSTEGFQGGDDRLAIQAVFYYHVLWTKNSRACRLLQGSRNLGLLSWMSGKGNRLEREEWIYWINTKQTRCCTRILAAILLGLFHAVVLLRDKCSIDNYKQVG